MSNYHDDESTPAVCDSCLGSNQYVEMKRQKNGAECKICSTPFTVFKWNSEKGKNLNSTVSLKKTVICLTCARSKNCCQSCLLDLTFGIDLNTRDNLLKLAKFNDVNKNKNKNGIQNIDDVVTNAKNLTSRLYNSRQLKERFSNTEISHLIDNEDSKLKLENNLQSLINKNNNNNKLELNTKQKIKQNFNSNNSSISNKELLSLIKSLPFNGNLQYIPKNNLIKSLFFFGNPSNLSIYQIKDYFINLSSEFDKSSISSLFTENTGKFGFIEFTNRKITEKIASIIYNSQIKISSNDSYKYPCLIIIDKHPLRICWAIQSTMTSKDFSNDQLLKISTIVDKQLIKLSKYDTESNKKSNLINSNSKISKN
jgi:pre-mRNA-splicing factor RBM22/SLT11